MAARLRRLTVRMSTLSPHELPGSSGDISDGDVAAMPPSSPRHSLADYNAFFLPDHATHVPVASTHQPSAALAALERRLVHVERQHDALVGGPRTITLA